jgi:2-keto-4-pentenoate hydratase
MSNLDHISRAFLSARREAAALTDFPGNIPQDLTAAYAVQAKSIADWGEPVVGYKVGGIPPHWREQYPSPWLAGPVFPSLVHRVDNHGTIDIPVYAGGFAAFEPELVFTLGGLSALKGPIETVDEAKPFVKAVHIGAEIASSPFGDINDCGPGSIISDFGNQSGVVMAQEIDVACLDRITDIHCAMTINGEKIAQKSPADGDAGPLGALRFLLNHILAHPPSMGLPDEIILSSGAITGVHRSVPSSTGHMDYGPLGSLTVVMTEREPLSINLA